MPQFEPASRYTIKNLEEQKALMHPLAGALMQLLQDQEMTLQQAADRLSLKSGHLQYYLRRLLKAKMVKLVRKVDTGRNLEKYYRAIAYRYSMPAKKEMTPEARRIAVEYHAGLVREYALRMEKTPGQWAGEVNRLRVRPEDLGVIAGKIEEIMIEFRNKRANDPEALDYKSVWTCFPIHGTGIPVKDDKENKGDRNNWKRGKG